MKNIICKNKNYRVIKEEVIVPYINEEEKYIHYRYKLQKKGWLFWKTIVTHPYILTNKLEEKSLHVYMNLYKCINSATHITE